MAKACSGWSALLVALLVASCAAPLETSGRLEVCRAGRCGPAAQVMTENDLLDSLYSLFRDNAAMPLTLCDAKGGVCQEKNISFFVQGGPIPGVASIDKADTGSIVLDRARKQIRLDITYHAAFIGVPTVCGRSQAVLSVAAMNDVRIESGDFYCNWLVVGNVLWNGRYVIDHIDFDKGILAGSYSMGGGGFLAAGGGKGQFAMGVKQETTAVVAAAAVAAAPAPVPAPVLAPAPTPPPAEPAPAPKPADVTKAPPQKPERPAPQPDTGTRPDDIAVIIGNKDYGKLGRDIPNVKPAHADADAFRRYAIRNLGLREGNIIDLRDATGAQMTRVFGSRENHCGQLFDWTRPGRSRVFVYYSGHGAPADPEATSYLVPVDADASRIALNGYPLDVLYANLGKLPAVSVSVVLEACFSGASQAGAVVGHSSGIYVRPRPPSIPPAFTVITAGSASQVASWEENGSQSLFTRHFLDGLTGRADQPPSGNGDGSVTHRELEAYLKDTTTYFARRLYGRDQTPEFHVGATWAF